MYAQGHFFSSLTLQACHFCNRNLSVFSSSTVGLRFFQLEAELTGVYLNHIFSGQIAQSHECQTRNTTKACLVFSLHSTPNSITFSKSLISWALPRTFSNTAISLRTSNLQFFCKQFPVFSSKIPKSMWTDLHQFFPTPSATLTLTCLETLDCLHRFHKVPTFQPTHKTLHRLQSKWSRRYPKRDHSDVFKNFVAKLVVSACFSQFLPLVDAFSAGNVEESHGCFFVQTTIFHQLVRSDHVLVRFPYSTTFFSCWRMETLPSFFRWLLLEICGFGLLKHNDAKKNREVKES